MVSKRVGRRGTTYRAFSVNFIDAITLNSLHSIRLLFFNLSSGIELLFLRFEWRYLHRYSHANRHEKFLSKMITGKTLIELVDRLL